MRASTLIAVVCVGVVFGYVVIKVVCDAWRG